MANVEELSWRWEQIEGPSTSLDDATQDAPSFRPDVPGRYGFEVTGTWAEQSASDQLHVIVVKTDAEGLVGSRSCGVAVPTAGWVLGLLALLTRRR